jgi:hypothetical protein
MQASRVVETPNIATASATADRLELSGSADVDIRDYH